MSWLIFLVVVIGAFPGLGRAEMRYVYQTRYTKHPPNVARFDHVAVKLGDESVGLFGGFWSGDVELFNPATEQFLKLPIWHAFGNFSGTALLDGRALLVDGLDDSIFDFKLQEFVAPQNLYVGGFVRFPVLVPLADGQVFICGGWDNDFQPLTTCGLFDPGTLRFREAGQLQVPRVFHEAIALDDHRVLIAGGYDDRDPCQPRALNSLEIFDTTNGLSTLLPVKLRWGRYNLRSVNLPDGKVLILGGTPSFTDYWLRSTEIFDPNTNTLTLGPDLGLGRNGARVAVLPSGRIAVFGGHYDARAVELYCPQTGTWVLADHLTLDPRWSDFTATALDSGAVLLVGGTVNGGIDAIPNAEIFQEAVQEVNAPTPSDVRTEKWCVELWDGDVRRSTVWLTGYESPEKRDVAHPHPYFTAILRATEEVSFTRLVVHFSKYAPYEARVRLFNLVGWTRVPEVVLGDDLDADTLQTRRRTGSGAS